ncbi:hypothetical protein SAMN05444682_11563 [Parapedobacter indicus]|uniref:Uncharacterized protein n=1 Tax=Parapedobacter indicus TaxID=1477437 RepID=A0A1I3UTJ1_9SPHI|nr:hypothetical protein CLV26_115115 [Parapedobacter indicus]SFJ86538.1 hypothetical protein SAMN05444682_11563 [Parapedobacter indicus]
MRCIGASVFKALQILFESYLQPEKLQFCANIGVIDPNLKGIL